MLKRSTSTLKASLYKTKSSPTARLHEPQSSNRENKIFSQRLSMVPQATKRQSIIETPRRTYQSKPGKLTYSKNLFKNARKVDANNPRQSFLPLESKLKTDNQAKVKVLLKAYSKLHGRPRECSSLQKPTKMQKMAKIDEVGQSQFKECAPFCQPTLSSLTKLILNECKVLCLDNVNPRDCFDSSLHDFLEEERYSDWINILCGSTITPKRNQDDDHSSLEDNPYQLPMRKTNFPKRHTHTQQSDCVLRA